MSVFERQLMEQLIERELPEWATHAAVSLITGEVMPAAQHPVSRRMVSNSPALLKAGDLIVEFATGRWKFILLRTVAPPTLTQTEAIAVAALHRIVNMVRNLIHPEPRDICNFEIALEGLGYTAREIRAEVMAVIQAKRDRDAARQAAKAEAGDAP